MIGQQEIAKMDEYGVPGYMQDGLVRYFNDHESGGHFLTALLENDLMEAINRADNTNQKAIPAYAKWLYNWADLKAYGSKAKVKAWIENKEDKEGP